MSEVIDINHDKIINGHSHYIIPHNGDFVTNIQFERLPKTCFLCYGNKKCQLMNSQILIPLYMYQYIEIAIECDFGDQVPVPIKVTYECMSNKFEKDMRAFESNNPTLIK